MAAAGTPRRKRPAPESLAGAAPFGAASPVGVAVGELVELVRNLDVGPGDGRIAGVVVAFEGVDVPGIPPHEPGQRLVGAAVAALDRDVADVDRAVALGVEHPVSLPARARRV